MDNEEFIRLEQLVDTLIEKYRDLKGEYRVLEESLQESERERDALQMELVELQDQRSEISHRISGLLGRIEQWESDQDLGEQLEGQQEQEENEHVSESDSDFDFDTSSESESDLGSDSESDVGFDANSTSL